MFLSKLFGIFKRKKSNPEGEAPASSPSGPVVPPSSSSVGAGVGAGLGQSGPQPQTPTADQLAQAPQEPSFNPGGLSDEPSPQPASETSDTSASDSIAQATAPQTGDNSDPLGSIPSAPVNDDPQMTDGGNQVQQPPEADGSVSDSPAAGVDISPAPSPTDGSADTGSNADDNQNIAV